MAGMETLGLSSERQQSDNIFQRLFWPTIREQEDVDLIGYQSFWLCFALAVISLLGILSGGPIALFALLGALLYLGAACGVRQRSATAASLMFALYLLNTLQILILAPGLGLFMFLRFVLLALLASNIRATILAARWANRTPPEIDPYEMRTTSTIGDKIANRMPPLIWPVIKWWALPLLSLAVLAMLITDVALAIRPKQPTSPQSSESPATYTVEPSN
jgi:hypothetical protein